MDETKKYTTLSGNETSIESLIQTIKYILNIDFKVDIKDLSEIFLI